MSKLLTSEVLIRSSSLKMLIKSSAIPGIIISGWSFIFPLVVAINSCNVGIRSPSPISILLISSIDMPRKPFRLSAVLNRLESWLIIISLLGVF